MEKNWSTVQLHCRECNARMMDYTLCQDDGRIVLQGITIKCNRCKRVMMLNVSSKYNADSIKKKNGTVCAHNTTCSGPICPRGRCIYPNSYRDI